jgi:integrase
MPSEYFSGHTLTKVRNMIKKGGSERLVVFRDSETKGLAIKVSKSGASWYFSTRDTNLHIARFLDFGLEDLSSLRELVVELKKEAAKGRDIKPMIDAFSARRSVSEARAIHGLEHGDTISWDVARDMYLDWAADNKNKDTVRGYRSALGVTVGLHADFQPLHGKPLPSITTADLAQVRNNVIARCRDAHGKGRGIRQADLTVAALKAAFRYFVNTPSLGLKTNPAADLSKALERSVKSTVEKRPLTQIELGAYWHALLSCSNETARLILQLQLLTGQRRFTPTSARKDAFQFGGAYACVWGMEDKTHSWRKLPLPPTAAGVVEQALRLARLDSEYLFPKQRIRRAGDDIEGHINERTVSEKIEDMRRPGGVFELMDWDVATHDMRKTFTSVMSPKLSQFQLEGRPLSPREITIITHQNEGRETVSQKVYDRNSYLDVKFAILAFWERYVLEGYRMYCEQKVWKKVA